MPTKGEDTSVVNLSLDKGSRIEVTRRLIQLYARGDNFFRSNLQLGANLESNGRGRCLGVVDSLSTSFNVRAYAVIVARGKGAEIGETLESNGIIGRREASGGRVSGDTALSDIVRGFCTNEEAIMAHHGVGGQSGALWNGERVVVKSVGGEEKIKGRVRTLKTSRFARV